MNTKKVENNIKLYIFVILLGAVVGIVLWAFLRLLGLCKDFLWHIIPEAIGVNFISVIICAVGGLLMGLLHKRYGDYPEELPIVLGKIKRDRHYEYHPMLALLACAFIPLAFGASVGPEAGLTGIVAGLCYWLGDNVKYAKQHADAYSNIGAAVMLGSLFHSPLFGIFAVEEDTAYEETVENFGLPKVSKLLLYGLSMASAFLVMKGLGAVFCALDVGFPGFEAANVMPADYWLILLYVPVGLVLFAAYFYAKKLAGLVSSKIPVIVRETICGLCIGIMSMLVPAVLFSGEEQMGLLPDLFMGYTPAMLIGVSFLKIVMTTFCIEFGLKGGHFFPLIYACSSMGFGVALLIFGAGAPAHAVFAAAIITAATLGAQIRRPIAVSMLLLICFPFRFVLWILLAAAAGVRTSALITRD